jgi:tryptophan-rich sensory protein
MRPHAAGPDARLLAVSDDRRTIEALGLAGSLAGVGLAAGIGGVVTSRGLPWYRRLEKPPYAPPDWGFGPTRALLYATQAVSAWLVWRGDARRAEYDVPAMISYGAQMALNLTWVLLFFGLRKPALALAEICVLWVAIVVTIREFARKHRFAAALLVPYLAWVTYAAVLNAGYWRRNR